jgi:hypothetical protein
VLEPSETHGWEELESGSDSDPMLDSPDVFNIPDPQLHPRIIWANPNEEIISRLCNRLCLADKECNVVLEEIKLLIPEYPIPKNVRMLRKAERVALSESSFDIVSCPIPQPLGSLQDPMLESSSYDLVHYNILDVCERLVNVKEHAPYLHWNFSEEHTVDGVSADAEGESRFFSELWTTDWWRDEEKKLPCSQGNILAVMLSSDETHVTLTGRKMHPLYVYCGNYHRWFKSRQSGWALLGFLPVIRACKGYSNHAGVRQYRRLVKRWLMGVIVAPVIARRDGYIISAPDEDGGISARYVYPRMPFFVGDEPEVMSSVTSGFRGACNQPCTNCDICPSDIVFPPHDTYTSPLMRKGNARSPASVTIHWNPESSSSTMPKEVSQQLSIHPEFNDMFYVPGMNPFNNPPCRMHQTDHGIFKSMLQTIVDFFKKFGGRGAINSFDHRWRGMLRYPGMKSFGRGVSDLKYVTAAEHRWMSMCLPFVCRNLDVELNTTGTSGVPRHLIECMAITYLSWRWMLGAEGHTHVSLHALTAVGHHLQKLIAQLTHITYGKRIVEGPKYHKIIHWPEYIQRFGCTGNYNAEVFECAHRFTVKKWVHKLNFSGSHAQQRILFQTSIYDAHIRDAVEEGNGTSMNSTQSHEGLHGHGSRRWGNGGFLGRINLITAFTLSKLQIHALESMEASDNFASLAIEEVIEKYCDIIPDRPSFIDIVALSQILQTNSSFQSIVPVGTSDTHIQEDGLIRFFTPKALHHVRLWNKSWCSKSSAYIKHGSDVVYSISIRQRWTERTGRVKWIISVDECQFIVLQRMREVPYRGGPVKGEDPHVRLVRQRQMNARSSTDVTHDPLRLHCWYLELLSSHDVIYLDRSAQTGKIEAVIMTQPDFASITSSQSIDEASRFFLVEYVIQ